MSNRPKGQPSRSARVQAARHEAERSRLWWIVGGVIVVIAFALLIAILVTGSDDDAEGGREAASGGTVVPSGDLDHGTVEVEGEPLAQLAAGGADPAAGQPIPTVVGETFDTSTVRIAPDGRPKVVLFLAHWCPHCQAEVPRLQEWLNDNGMPADVEVASVATSTTSSRPNFPPGNWLRREGWSVSTLVDDESATAANAYGLTGFPFFVAVDAEGNVVTRASGELSTEQWEALLDAARTGRAPGITGGPESPA
jgi:cytochrome c biogenesis protein CcmG, thiol:disulfide interchange protein DsbE